jgi:hypothetical protein
MENNPGEHDPVPQSGRTNPDAVENSPFAVVAEVERIQSARQVVEDLEEHGIPTTAISLLGVETKDPERPGRASDVAESRAFASVSKSTIAGGAGGAVIGAVLGIAMVAFAVPDLGWAWGAVLGAIFGSAIGGAAGGMSVAKYSSPAWHETYQTAEAGHPSVVVSHGEEAVIRSAAEVMSRHDTIVTSITQYESGSRVDR